MRRVRPLLCLGLLLALTAPAQAAVVPDPSAPGPLAVTRAEYDLGQIEVSGTTPTPTIEQDLRGDVHAPVGSGPFPVLVFLHGYHKSCEDEGSIDAGCPQVRSWEGYDTMARELASNGYVVLSLSANQINQHQGDVDAQEEARAQTIGASLELLERWGAGTGPGPLNAELRGRLDLSRIGLMGHSRGGEGVARFVIDNAATHRWALKGVVAIAPIDSHTQVPVGVPYATLLPYCDGDVINLDGAGVFERVRGANAAQGLPSVAWGVNGADHDFFNARWALDPDDVELTPYTSQDSACRVGAERRLAVPEQQAVGNVLTAAWLRERVGGESRFEPISTGAGLPASVCPARERAGLTCANVVQTSYEPPAAQQRLVLGPRVDGATVPATTQDGLAAVGSGGLTAIGCFPSQGSEQAYQLADAACGHPQDRSPTPQLSVDWAAPGALTLPLPAGGLDVSAFGTLTLRASAAHEDARNAAGDPDLDIALVDAAGHEAVQRASASSTALQVLPGTTARKIVLNGIRIPLARFAGIDLRHVVRIELRTASPTGAIQLADVAFQEPAAAAAPPAQPQVAAADQARRGTLAGRGLPVRVACPAACDVRLSLGPPRSRRHVTLGPGGSAVVRVPGPRVRAGRVLRLRSTVVTADGRTHESRRLAVRR